jgi:hypothetical protein
LAFAGAGTPRRATILALIREWNKNVTLFNNAVVKRNVGRPLEASEAQIKTVRALRRRGAYRAASPRKRRSACRPCAQSSINKTTSTAPPSSNCSGSTPTLRESGSGRPGGQMRPALPRRIAAVEKAPGSQGAENKHHVTA